MQTTDAAGGAVKRRDTGLTDFKAGRRAHDESVPCRIAAPVARFSEIRAPD
jgi:hypothetical protein